MPSVNRIVIFYLARKSHYNYHLTPKTFPPWTILSALLGWKAKIKRQTHKKLFDNIRVNELPPMWALPNENVLWTCRKIIRESAIYLVPFMITLKEHS